LCCGELLLSRQLSRRSLVVLFSPSRPLVLFCLLL
jgi:hypothetical protein